MKVRGLRYEVKFIDALIYILECIDSSSGFKDMEYGGNVKIL